MSKQRPEFTQDSFYHIFNRGAHKQKIFKEHSNYLFVLQNLKKYSKEFELTIIAYCLMPNHYHLLVQQNGEFPAGFLPQRVFNSYTKAFNNSYSHSGTLFEGPYRLKIVDEDDYLIHLCKYIHTNPVKAGLVEYPEEWIYSNYQEFIGLRKGNLINQAFMDNYFQSREDYQNFVMEDLLDQKMPEGINLYLKSLEAV
jgi:putative transposase